MSKRGRGQPPKCTPDLIQKIAAVLANKNTQRTACQVAGISEASFCDWYNLGEAGERKHGGIYIQFFEKVNEAKAISKMSLVQDITKAAEAGDWRAAAWILERTFRDEYTEKRTTELSGPDGGPIRHDGPPPLVINVTGVEENPYEPPKG